MDYEILPVPDRKLIIEDAGVLKCFQKLEHLLFFEFLCEFMHLQYKDSLYKRYFLFRIHPQVFEVKREGITFCKSCNFN